MKKLFIVLAVASLGFVACNNEGTKSETPDSPAVTPSETPVITGDTSTVKIDTTTADTTGAKVDTTTKK